MTGRTMRATMAIVVAMSVNVAATRANQPPPRPCEREPASRQGFSAKTMMSTQPVTLFGQSVSLSQLMSKRLSYFFASRSSQIPW